MQDVGKRKEEEQHRALKWGIDHRGTEGSEHHQQIDVDRPLPQRSQPGAHTEVPARKIGTEVKNIVPRHAAFCRDPASDHEDKRQHHGQRLQSVASCQMGDPLASVGRLVLNLRLIALHWRASFADSLDHLLLRKPGIVKGYRHHSTHKSRPRATDAVNLLRLVLQFLLRRARCPPAEMQNGLAVLLMSDGRKFLHDLAHTLIRNHLGVEINGHLVMHRIHSRAQDPRLIWRGKRN